MAMKKISSSCAVLVVCVVVLLATSAHTTVAQDDDPFVQCFRACIDDCKAAGSGNTFCEIRCDGKCVTKEGAAKLMDLGH